MSQSVRISHAKVRVRQNTDMSQLEALYERFALCRTVGRHPDYEDAESLELGGDALQTGELISAVWSPLAPKKQEDRWFRERDRD